MGGVINKNYLWGGLWMNFKAYAELKRKEAHKEIIIDICLLINNCAGCYDDVKRKTDCNPLSCVELHKVTADSFNMDPYDSKTNRELIDIAVQHGYKAGFIMEGTEVTEIKFWKEK